jgi:DNA-binding FadR family transcriptional regulator
MEDANGDSRRRSADQVSVRVARLILDAVNRGEFAVGSRLPSERVLADRFEVSRPSLREALSALEFAGIVESRRGFGSVVVSRERKAVGQEEDAHYSRVDLIEARIIFEPEAVRLAAVNPDTQAIAHARTLLDGMWFAVQSAADVGADTDLNVHIALVQICRNSIVRSAALHVLHEARTKHWMTARSAAWTDPRTIEAWTIQHESTLSAIMAGNGERAARASRHHLLSVVELVATKGRLNAVDRRRIDALLKVFSPAAPAVPSATVQ